MSRIIIFAKAPVAGLSKTRLAPALGFEGAAQLAKAMLASTLKMALSAQQNTVELRVEPDSNHPYWQPISLPQDVMVTAQGPGDLGARLLRAASEGLSHDNTILLIGTDCPTLTTERLQHAAAELQTHDAVIQPAHDGGYVLLGLRQCDAILFEQIPWSTSRVFVATCEAMSKLGWRFSVLSPLHDIDEPSDLIHLPANLREHVTHG